MSEQADSTTFLVFFQVKQHRLSCSSKAPAVGSHTMKEIKLKTIWLFTPLVHILQVSIGKIKYIASQHKVVQVLQ